MIIVKLICRIKLNVELNYAYTYIYAQSDKISFDFLSLSLLLIQEYNFFNLKVCIFVLGWFRSLCFEERSWVKKIGRIPASPNVPYVKIKRFLFINLTAWHGKPAAASIGHLFSFKQTRKGCPIIISNCNAASKLPDPAGLQIASYLPSCIIFPAKNLRMLKKNIRIVTRV